MIRDSKWEGAYYQALTFLKLPKEACEHYANTAQKMRELNQKIEDEKRQKFTKFLAIAPKNEPKTCRATLMNSKQCSGRAMCGDYCKRHRLIN